MPPGLLPAGLRDLLPPEAETEAAAVEAVMSVFTAHGYQRVKPPLLEYEDSLLAGSGGAVAEQTFRLMDPNTQRMMGVRADMTPQVARLAATRLRNAPRPLRLSYAGQCLRVRGTQLAPDRQVAQAGIELIGPDLPEADAEVVLVGAEALAAIGLTRVSIDLTLPAMTPALLDSARCDLAGREHLVHALDRKDAAEVARYGGSQAGLLTELLLTAGPADVALATLAAAPLPSAARALAERLTATVRAIHARAPELCLTLDPLEFRGFRYETGVCATVYALDRPEELGRGGRYLTGNGEPATGLTLFPDAMLRAAPARQPRPRIYVPFGRPDAPFARLRGQGFATVSALFPAESPEADAHRLGCTHILRDGVPVPLHPES